MLVKFMMYHLLVSFCTLRFNGSRKDLLIFKQHYKFIISILNYFQNLIHLVHSFIHFLLISFLLFFHPSHQSFQIFNVHSFISLFWLFIIFIYFHHFPHPFIHYFNFIVFLFIYLSLILFLWGWFQCFLVFFNSPSADHCGTLENSNFQLKQSFIQFEYSWSVHVQNIQILTKIFQFFKL